MLHAHGITLKALPLKIVWLKADILPTYSEGSDDENEIIMGDRENREDNADINRTCASKGIRRSSSVN